MELADFYQTVAALNEAGMTATTVYLTVVSAYIIAAYIAGRGLNASQLTIISVLFISFSLFFSYGSFRFFSIALVLTQEQFDTGYPILPYTLFLAEIVGILAAIKFMLDIRKDNSKE